jgi:hypothetical protein
MKKFAIKSSIVLISAIMLSGFAFETKSYAWGSQVGDENVIVADGEIREGDVFYTSPGEDGIDLTIITDAVQGGTTQNPPKPTGNNNSGKDKEKDKEKEKIDVGKREEEIESPFPPGQLWIRDWLQQNPIWRIWADIKVEKVTEHKVVKTEKKVETEERSEISSTVSSYTWHLVNKTTGERMDLYNQSNKIKHRFTIGEWEAIRVPVFKKTTRVFEREVTYITFNSKTMYIREDGLISYDWDERPIDSNGNWIGGAFDGLLDTSIYKGVNWTQKKIDKEKVISSLSSFGEDQSKKVIINFIVDKEGIIEVSDNMPKGTPPVKHELVQ